uniref:Regulatory protein zeste n=1 Tax=Panagrolaimus sp. PS1159 TaxID=55785 RepID=A0AC35GQQ3_9BILA
MRSDQTLRLVQLYHDNYPEISKHTQDIEGRRRKMEIWKNITDELNASFDTNFTVEQYKKKLQNVQCTSRQKLQTGKRPTDNTTHKFSPAEREFIRLFESGTRDSSPNLLNGIKVEDLIQQFGAAVSDHCSSVDYINGSRNQTPTEISSNNSTNNENDFSTGNLTSQDILNQQLLLLLNNSHLLPNLSVIGNNGISHNNNNMDADDDNDDAESEEVNEPDGPEGAREPPNLQVSPAATSSSSSDFGGIKKMDENKIIREMKVTASSATATGSAKRKKRKLEASPEIHCSNGNSGDEFGALNDSSSKFANEMVRLQKQILANQELILQELRHNNQPPKTSRIETELGTLIGTKLDRLCDCLIEVVSKNSHKRIDINNDTSSAVSNE